MTDTGRPRPAGATAARALGIALAVAGLALFVALVGAGAVLDALSRVSPAAAGGLVAAGLVPVVVWGLSLRIALRTLGVEATAPGAVALFLASTFLNAVTPFGQVGGDPPSGLLVAHAEGATFESGLAAVAGVNALNRVAAVLLGAAGAAALLARAGIPEGIRTAVVAAVGVVLAVAAAFLLLWARRDAAVPAVGTALAAVAVPVAERLPFVRPPSRASVARRVRAFAGALGRLGAHPARLAAVFLLGVAGQGAVAAVLWLALAGLGVRVAPGVVLVVVPVAKLGGLAPLPGGSVGAEALVSGLLVAAAGVAAPAATAAALLYRAAAFWVPTALGGAATVALLARPGGRG